MALGGSFRALGSAFFVHEKYPLPVLHGTKIGSDKVLALCDGFTAAVPDLDGVPLARRQTMPMAGKIIRSLVHMSGVKRLVVSGTSIRDGVIAINELKTGATSDFLVAISQEIALATGRFAGASDVENFVLPLALVGSKASQRLINVACNLADICWHEHSDLRGDIAARRVLGLPVNCMTHKERVWLSVALYHRYVGLKRNKPRPRGLDSLLGRRHVIEATTIGLALRFALIFSAGTTTHLNHIGWNACRVKSAFTSRPQRAICLMRLVRGGSMRWPLAPSLTPRLCLTAKDVRSATGGNWHDGTRNEHMSGSDFLLSHDFIDLFDDGLLLVQDNGAVEAANAAAIRSFGKQLVGTNIEFLFPGSGILALFKQASESQFADEISYAHDGAVDLVFKVRACRMNANLVAILFLDMTFQRNLDNVRRDFVANVSHELRSPLTSLAGFVETMLTQNVTDPEMQHRFLMIMQEEAQRMSRLLDDLFVPSRVELEQHIRPTETVPVLEVIEAVVRSFESRLQARGMSIKIDARAFTSGPAADNPPRCQGNHDEITEVFVNIIENAIKYGARDSDIDITVG